MIQRSLARKTKSRSFVAARKVDSQYFVGSASPFGHSISSHSSGRGSVRFSSRCAGRTRNAANRERSRPFVPGRQLMLFHAVSGNPCASVRTETGRWFASRRSRLGGWPRPLQAFFGNGPSPTFQTVVEELTPRT